MNDLDRDLEILFEERARDVQPSPLPPAGVLKRARHRQVGTGLFAGAVAVLVVAVGLAGAAALVGRSDEVPLSVGRPGGYPQRTVTIQGLTATAPEGWTLTDLWPTAAYIEADVTECSFTGTGSPVGPDGDAAAAEEPREECTTSPSPLPAGIPVMQISNRDLGVPPVCDLEGNDPADVPADAAVLYVAALPEGRPADGFTGSCPQGAETSSFTSGDVTYVSVVVLGPQSTPDDAAYVRGQANGLTGQGMPAVEAPAANGPGYVVAAGASEGFAWRLEAGFNPPTDVDALGLGGVLILTDDHGAETMTSVPLPTRDPVVARTEPLGATSITWGAADPTVTSIDVVTGTGDPTPATMVGWPDSLQSFMKDATPLEGSLWWVVTAEPGQKVRATGADGTTTTWEVDQGEAVPG